MSMSIYDTEQLSALLSTFLANCEQVPRSLSIAFLPIFATAY
jgi:hypothetical protein